jgi:hypothetical protein
VEDRLLKPDSARRSWWRLPLLLLIVLAAMMWWQSNRPHEARQAKNDNLPTPILKNDRRPKVALTIDYGNGRRMAFAAIEWHDGMTVADLMAAWTNVAVKQKGSGESAFVTTIDGIENQGADGKNWIYSVSGQVGDRSFAVYQLKPEDRVLWTFGPRQ